VLESPYVSTLLEVEGLTKDYAARGGGTTMRAVDDVTFAVAAGETLGVVGESGCGKSTLARLVLRLIEPTAGTVRFMGSDLTALSAGAMRLHRRNLQIVFQDPYASLDPRMTVAAIISEPLDIHRVGDRKTRRRRVLELLDLVGLNPAAADRYPHEFSGGQRQRIGIARALALDPMLLVLDEPVSALDVSIQAQVLNLLLELKSRLQLSYIFISHDLSVIEHVSDRIAVMYLGRIVESGPAEALFHHPLHPYTRALIAAIPGTGRERLVLLGDPPSPENLPSGCHFHPRCPMAQPLCTSTAPVLRVIEQDRMAECHFATPAAPEP
jgi:oligopeptide transport system ATP-binding protein